MLFYTLLPPVSSSENLRMSKGYLTNLLCKSVLRPPCYAPGVSALFLNKEFGCLFWRFHSLLEHHLSLAAHCGYAEKQINASAHVPVSVCSLTVLLLLHLSILLFCLFSSMESGRERPLSHICPYGLHKPHYDFIILVTLH